MTYDKENHPINKPYEKKAGRPRKNQQMVKSFIDTENIESNGPETRKGER